MLRDVEWSRNRCCWPIGDPKLPGFAFCGTSIIPGGLIVKNTQILHILIPEKVKKMSYGKHN